MNPKVLLPVFALLLGITGFFIWKSRVAQPTPYERTFTANGVVEQADFKDGQCIIKVAIYDWVNLSEGFKLADIPERSDRYIVHGSGESCQALPIAMSATNQHISFEVGYSRNQWSFINNPKAALSCGGVKMNWLPDPES
jgi:hypothetical protein